MTLIALTALLLFSLFAFSIGAIIWNKIGVNYGRQGNNILPSPYQSIELLKSMKAGWVKLYDADPETLKLLAIEGKHPCLNHGAKRTNIKHCNKDTNIVSAAAAASYSANPVSYIPNVNLIDNAVKHSVSAHDGVEQHGVTNTTVKHQGEMKHSLYKSIHCTALHCAAIPQIVHRQSVNAKSTHDGVEKHRNIIDALIAVHTVQCN